MDDVRQTFKEYFELYQRELFRFVALKVADKQTAEDITAQVFLRLFEKMLAQQIIAQPRALLYHMARGAIIDEYRRAGRRPTSSLTEDIVELFVTESASVPMDVAYDYESVLQAIQGLKVEYRDIILLHYVEELSIAEIAHIMEETENNIRVRLHRALAKLRKQFKHE